MQYGRCHVDSIVSSFHHSPIVPPCSTLLEIAVVMCVTLGGIFYYSWRINGLIGAFLLQAHSTQQEFGHQMSIVDTYCTVGAETARAQWLTPLVVVLCAKHYVLAFEICSDENDLIVII